METHLMDKIGSEYIPEEAVDLVAKIFSQQIGTFRSVPTNADERDGLAVFDAIKHNEENVTSLGRICCYVNASRMIYQATIMVGGDGDVTEIARAMTSSLEGDYVPETHKDTLLEDAVMLIQATKDSEDGVFDALSSLIFSSMMFQ